MVKILFLLIAMCRLKFRPCGNAPPQIPTFSYVPDICRIVGRSGINDSKNFIFTDSNVPLQKSNKRNCKNDVHFQYAVFAFIE